MSPDFASCSERRLETPILGINVVEDREGEGFASRAAVQSLHRIAALGLDSVALVIPARLPDLSSNALYSHIPVERATLARLVAAARDLDIRTLVVPHLWVDGDLWRGDIRRTGKSADAFFDAYGRWLMSLAEAAEAACADGLSIGVELKGLSGDPDHEPRFAHLIHQLRSRFKGLITYSANWDEAIAVRFWPYVDIIAVNAFHPLSVGPDPTHAELTSRARALTRELDLLAQRHDRPVLIMEAGYRAAGDNTREPWTWPSWSDPLPVDERAQRRAYAALLEAIREQPRIIGVLFWLAATGTDQPDRRALEPPWGFSPFGKLAEQEIRNHASWVRARRKLGGQIEPAGARSGQRRP